VGAGALLALCWRRLECAAERCDAQRVRPTLLPIDAVNPLSCLRRAEPTPSIHLPLHLSHGSRARDRMDIAIATCVTGCAFPRTVSIDSIQLKRHCASSGPLGMARVRNSYDGTPVDAVSTIATAEGGGSTNRGHVLTLVPTLRRNNFRNTEAHPPLSAVVKHDHSCNGPGHHRPYRLIVPSV
jgi:hypothetical protein